MLTAISACYGIGYTDIMAMPVAVRTRYYENVARHEAERKLHLAEVIMLPHMERGISLVYQRWQMAARWIRMSTAQSVRSLRHFLHQHLDPRYGRVED